MHTTQVLSTRARKDVALADIKVNVCVFLFDCLYLNGRSLLQCPLTERRQALYSAIKVGRCSACREKQLVMHRALRGRLQGVSMWDQGIALSALCTTPFLGAGCRVR